ncbi:hypothetical protein GEMRC1_005931 [Eukaryota sp. GEM-RC1]
MAQTVQSFLGHKTDAGCRIAFVVSGSGTGKTAALADALENNYGFYLNFGAGTPGITPSCEAFKLIIERGQFMSLRVQNVGLIATIQIIFLQLLFAHVEVFNEQRNMDPKSWFHFSTSPEGQLSIVEKFLALIKTDQAPDFSKLSPKTSHIVVLDEMCSVLNWNVNEIINSSDFFCCIRAVSCPVSFRCSFLADTGSEVLEHLPSHQQVNLASLDSVNRTKPEFFFCTNILRTAIQQKFPDVDSQDAFLTKTVNFLELIFRGWFFPIGVFVNRLRSSTKSKCSDAIEDILSEIEQIARMKVFPESVKTIQNLEIAAICVASSVLGSNVSKLRSVEFVQRRSARINSIIFESDLVDHQPSSSSSSQFGWIEWVARDRFSFKVELQQSLLSAYAVSYSMYNLLEAERTNVFKTLSAIIVEPSFRGHLDRRIIPFLNEIFTVFHFIHPSFEVVGKEKPISSFLYRLCVGEIDLEKNHIELPNDENQKLYETVFHCESHKCSVHHYEAKSPNFLFPCFALRYGSFSFSNTDVVAIYHPLDHKYVLSEHSSSESPFTPDDQSATNIGISQLGVAILPLDPQCRFDLFVPSISFNRYVPVEVRTRKQPSYEDIYSKFYSLEKASHNLYRTEAGGKCMILVNYAPRDYVVSDARPETTDFMLQFSGESLHSLTSVDLQNIPTDGGGVFELSQSHDAPYVHFPESQVPVRSRRAAGGRKKKTQRKK